jgi:hypothetical protein
MSGSSITSTPPVSPAEMQVLVSRAGLTLNPGQMADLVLAWRQMVGLLGLIPRDRPLIDDQAFVFRLPPPAAPAKPVVALRARKSAPPAGKKAASPAAKKAAAPAAKKAAAPAGKKAAARSGKQAAARKTVRRRR